MFQHVMWAVLGVAFFCVGIIMALSNLNISAHEKLKYMRHMTMVAIVTLILWFFMFVYSIFNDLP